MFPIYLLTIRTSCHGEQIGEHVDVNPFQNDEDVERMALRVAVGSD